MSQKKHKQTDPVTQAAIDVTEMDKIIEERQALAVLDEHKARIAPYTDDLPYDKGRIIAMAKHYLSNSMESAVKVGQYLIWMQYEEDDLTFKHILNEYLPEISRATAFNFMRIAKAVTEHPKLQEYSKQYTKVIALLENLSDDDIGALESGEKIAGLTLDEMDTTPRSQLVAQLKAHKAELNEQRKASERVQKGLHDQIDKAEKDANRLKSVLAETDLPETEALFVKKCEALRFAFDGFMVQLDFENIKELETDRDKDIFPSVTIRATYIALLHYMKMQLSYQSNWAEDLFYDAKMKPDDSWFNSPQYKKKHPEPSYPPPADIFVPENN